MKNKCQKSAFSLIELVFVIVVLGIVASIGSEVIAKLYMRYINAKVNNEAKVKLTHALHQINKYLQFRIKDTTIGRIPNSDTIASLTDATAVGNFEILEWIGNDTDSLNGQWDGTKNYPGFSGFIDIDNTNTNAGQLRASGSNLDYANKIIDSLSEHIVGLETQAQQPVIIFAELSQEIDTTLFWKRPPVNDYAHQVQCLSNSCTTDPATLDLIQNLPNAVTGLSEFVELAYLAWTAYAIVPQQNSEGDYNLSLFYNYQPWENERYDTDGSSSLLVEHISLFDFNVSGENSIEVRLCVDTATSGSDYNIALCAKEVIY